MSPRPYHLGRRRAISEQTRARILQATRELLEVPERPPSFSIDAVARQADVARMTVYYQFGSRAGLLEALFDDLANRGGMDRLPDAFRQPRPLDALDTFIGIFGQFYAADRLLTRRLRALSAIDPELEPALRARDERRRAGLRVILARSGTPRGSDVPGAGSVREQAAGGPAVAVDRDTMPASAWASRACDARRPAGTRPDIAAGGHDQAGDPALEDAITVLFTLTSFESFDTLAGGARDIVAVVPLVQRVARAIMNELTHAPGLPEPVRSRPRRPADFSVESP